MEVQAAQWWGRTPPVIEEPSAFLCHRPPQLAMLEGHNVGSRGNDRQIRTPAAFVHPHFFTLKYDGSGLEVRRICR